ncbi:hypothetical protein SPBR_01785 [Sporothrix brasiliensis 5110]|uniref:2EXR domain-containing protein n=1 Tax=Sporothrix brasiliensis 5110 TaxID=1398154 RepID=A0A0C2IQ41_9PEZI|nr:uncharacterized protein SPBR_01785 [Sporothrix brasiliensis 5110]KIH91151.1 hypothetical protein SPBR_01785 [Sporothrix brasiliensis 5110]
MDGDNSDYDYDRSDSDDESEAEDEPARRERLIRNGVASCPDPPRNLGDQKADAPEFVKFVAGLHSDTVRLLSLMWSRASDWPQDVADMYDRGGGGGTKNALENMSTAAVGDLLHGRKIVYQALQNIAEGLNLSAKLMTRSPPRHPGHGAANRGASVDTGTSTTFHGFGKLPTELQRAIWDAACEPIPCGHYYDSIRPKNDDGSWRQLSVPEGADDADDAGNVMTVPQYHLRHPSAHWLSDQGLWSACWASRAAMKRAYVSWDVYMATPLPTGAGPDAIPGFTSLFSTGPRCFFKPSIEIVSVPIGKPGTAAGDDGDDGDEGDDGLSAFGLQQLRDTALKHTTDGKFDYYHREVAHPMETYYLDVTARNRQWVSLRRQIMGAGRHMLAHGLRVDEKDMLMAIQEKARKC